MFRIKYWTCFFTTNLPISYEERILMDTEQIFLQKVHVYQQKKNIDF